MKNKLKIIILIIVCMFFSCTFDAPFEYWNYTTTFENQHTHEITVELLLAANPKTFTLQPGESIDVFINTDEYDKYYWHHSCTQKCRIGYVIASKTHIIIR